MQDVVMSPADGLWAKRVKFMPEPPTGRQACTEFTEPEPVFAVAEPISVEDLLVTKDEPNPANQLDFLFLQNNSPKATPWQKQAETWIAMPGGSTSPIELFVKYDRILWRPGRVLVQGQGAADQIEQIFSAVTAFAFYENELRKLEFQVHAYLKTAKGDVHLTHGVETSDLIQRSHVNEMTRNVTLARMKFVRLEPQMEKVSLASAGEARRLVFDLLNNANVSDRLQVVDDQLEVAEDLYELANDRLTEFRYYRNESILEWWVIFLLAVEVILLLVELYGLWPAHGG